MSALPAPLPALARPEALRALERQLAEVLAPTRPGSPGVATGLAALDRALHGGLPRGRLTEIVGAAGAGTTSLVRHLVASAVADGLAVAYVDATRTLAPRDWAFAGADAGDALWVVRPADPARGAWCADVLLRSGAFALVVVDGAPTLARPVAVRLTRLAREADAAFLVVGDAERGAPTLLGGALRLRVAPAGRGGAGVGPRAPSPWGRAAAAERHDGPDGTGRRRSERGVRRFVVVVEKGGAQQSVEVECAVGVARRLCTHPEVPDRRGALRARRAGGTAAVPGGTVAARAADGERPAGEPLGDADRPLAAGRPPGRKRRCAEPADFGRA